MNTKLLRLPEVLNRTGLSRSKLYELLEAGGFPKQVKLGERLNAWPEEDIEKWIQQRIAGRPDPAVVRAQEIASLKLSISRSQRTIDKSKVRLAELTGISDDA